MNLDTLYSELTLKTKTKLVLLVLDGLGDIATKDHNYAQARLNQYRHVSGPKKPTKMNDQ